MVTSKSSFKPFAARDNLRSILQVMAFRESRVSVLARFCHFSFLTRSLIPFQHRAGGGSAPIVAALAAFAAASPEELEALTAEDPPAPIPDGFDPAAMGGGSMDFLGGDLGGGMGDFDMP